MRTFTALTALFLAFFSAPLFASPELVVEGSSGTLVFDFEELEAFPQTTVVTASPYFDGKEEFSGPTLKRVVERFGLSGETTLTMHALNDYKVGGSVEQLMDLDAIIATRRDSKKMSVRNRGPFWVILPLSDRPELDVEEVHRFMVWQLSRISLEN